MSVLIFETDIFFILFRFLIIYSIISQGITILCQIVVIKKILKIMYVFNYEDVMAINIVPNVKFEKWHTFRY